MTNPGQTGYQKWAIESGLPMAENGPHDNPDGDAFSNLTEYTIGAKTVAQGYYRLIISYPNQY